MSVSIRVKLRIIIKKKTERWRTKSRIISTAFISQRVALFLCQEDMINFVNVVQIAFPDIVVLPNNHTIILNKVKEIERLSGFLNLDNLIIRDAESLDNDNMISISKIRNLRSLELVKLKEVKISSFNNFVNLSTLTLENCSLFHCIFPCINDLQELNILNCKVSGTLLNSIARLTTLKKLNFTNSRVISTRNNYTVNPMEFISSLIELISLNIDNFTALNSVDLHNICSLPKLENLSMKSGRIMTGVKIEVMSRLTNLESLSFVDGHSTPPIHSMIQLTSLKLRGCSFLQNDYFIGATNLTSLSLMGGNELDPFVITYLTNLTKLKLDQYYYLDQSRLIAIKELKSLTKVTLQCLVNEVDISLLLNWNNLIKLKITSRLSDTVVQEIFTYLKGSQNIQSLSLCTDYPLLHSHINEFKTMSNLKKLILITSNDMFNYSDSAMKEISKLKQLEEFYLSKSSSFEGINYLFEFINLKSLTLDRCSITRELLNGLAKLRQLKELRLLSCVIIGEETGSYVDEFQEENPKIKVIS